MTNKRVAKQFNKAVDETLHIQQDVSNWLAKVKDPRDPYLPISAQVLLSRCEANQSLLQSIQQQTDDNIILVTVAQHLILLNETKNKIRSIQTLAHASHNSIKVSNEAVKRAKLERFKQQLANNLSPGDDKK